MSPPRAESVVRLFSREEVGQHNAPDDLWIVIHGDVYDVSRWSATHPGGKKILQNHGGEDATVAYESFHINKNLVKKYMSHLRVGKVMSKEKEHPEIVKDFLLLREDLESKGYFKTSSLYFTLFIAHWIALELLALFILVYFNPSWFTWAVGVLLSATAYLQGSTLLHDSSHLSIFKSSKANSRFATLMAGLQLGLSSDWWKYRHQQHHAKPNVFIKDPDITTPFNFFLFGEDLPVKWGQNGWGWFPYQLQHLYFFIFGPPSYVTVYAPLEALHHTLTRGLWLEAMLIVLYYVRSYFQYSFILGGAWAAIGFHFAMRLVASHWWVWVTQISHIPMPVEEERHQDWVSQQISPTCNVESSLFIDWFMFHLNFQIEHHLFPTMPCHNFRAVAPYVREFCRKHGLHYTIKPGIWTGAVDVVK